MALSDVDCDDIKTYKSDTSDDEEEKRLEDVVFGSKDGILKRIKEHDKKSIKKCKNELGEQFELKKAVWNDEYDEELINVKKNQDLLNRARIHTNSSQMKAKELEEQLKEKYSKYYGTPLWADLDKKRQKQDEGDEDEDDEQNLLGKTRNYLTKSQYLPNGILDIKRCTNANKEAPHGARLRCVEFHPTARVMLTAGLNQTLTLFQIDGKKNPKIQSIFIEKFPILNAHFTKNGEEILMGSRDRTFYYYDMIVGKMVNVNGLKGLDENRLGSFEISPNNTLMAFIGSYGQVHLFSVKSKEWLDTLKVNGQVNTLTFSPDSSKLFVFGDEKDVHVFDVQSRTRSSLHKFADFGCLNGQSLAISSNAQYIATGDKSGVVNLYNLSDALSLTQPKPLRSFMNLTTSCTHLKFNSSSEILACCSSFAENSCKLIHVPSLSVFSNFPTRQEQMRIPMAIDFSLNSGYLSIGNHKGDALLYRLKHFGSF